jgi:hypothetical protein
MVVIASNSDRARARIAARLMVHPGRDQAKLSAEEQKALIEVFGTAELQACLELASE